MVNCKRGGGFWAGILQGRGSGSEAAGIFIYLQAQKKPLKGGGGLGGLTPPPSEVFFGSATEYL